MNLTVFEQLDTILRLLAIGGLFTMIILLLTSATRSGLKWTAIGLMVGATGYLINSSTTMHLPEPYRTFVDGLSISTTFWIWLFAHRLFERQIAKPLFLAPLLLGLFWIVAHILPHLQWFTFYAIHFVSLAMVVHLILIALAGRADDLIEKRRKIRMFLPLFVGLQVGGVLTYEILFGAVDGYPVISAINAALILILITGAALSLLRVDNEILSEKTVAAQVSSPMNNFSPSETVLHDKLMSAMEAGQYRTSSLTIQMLSEHLDTPEHRLRALINRKLGHRNFSSFLNGYRIREAKTKLADRDLVDVPILTIAMDLGYGSLAPFNRAFRHETGQTPSDFRKSAIDQN